MKKLSIFLSAILIAALLSVNVFAAPFVSSPGSTPGPELVEYENESSECTAELVITPYSHRDELDTELKSEIVEAFNQINNADDLSSLNSDLINVAQSKGISTKRLAVSELFDIHYIHCDIHKAHGSFRIKLKSESANKFIALMHFYNGKWELVDNAKVEDGYLVFSIAKFSPFAVVIDNSDDAPDASTTDNPSTGNIADGIKIGVLASVMCVSLVAGVILWKKSKKQAA